MESLLQTVEATIARHRMLSHGSKVLVAVSGGVDSVVLLTALDALASRLGIRLTVAHLDHTLRGAASTEDARTVAALADRLGLQLICERSAVRAAHERHGGNLEDRARRLRLAFLGHAARSVRAERVALGHHRNDRAETLLFHLARGGGPTGLAAMRPVNGALVRPLIDVTRAEIEEYAHAEGLSWREDASNNDLSLSRNRIRHRVLPLLAQLNPRVIEAIARTADLVAEERDALDLLLEPVWRELRADHTTGHLALSCDRAAALPSPVRHAVLRRAVAEARGHLRGIEKRHLDAVDGLLVAHEGHGEVSLPELIVTRTGDHLLFGRGTLLRPVTPMRADVELGRNPIPQFGCAITCAVTQRETTPEEPSSDELHTETADADRVRFPLFLRTRVPGDRFRPLGMRRDKRLQDFLVDARVPRIERDRLPLLCDQERIVWVVGVRLSDAVRVTPKTSRLLTLRAESLT